MVRVRTALLCAIFVTTACSHQPAAPPASQPASGAPVASAAAQPAGNRAAAGTPAAGKVVISIVGTNDLHGHIRWLPLLAGYVENLRAARAHDGGVLLLSAGDMFQGTLASNLTEGAAVISAYNAMRYDAAAIGNHEFDYGPAGKEATPQKPGDDPRGALKARVKQAHFPILSANLINVDTGRRVAWDKAHLMKTIDGVKIGVIGVSTSETPRTTIAANFVGLKIASLAKTIIAQARLLRKKGAQVIVVAAHAGGVCHKFDNPDDLSSCNPDEEIFHVANAIPKGTVDVIVAGHTHHGIAHRVNGIAVIESYSYGRAFGRVDLTVAPATGKILGEHIFKPHWLCSKPHTKPSDAACAPGDYAGAPVKSDPAIARIIAKPIKMAAALRSKPLGVKLAKGFRRAYRTESALGDLVADLMRKARPRADVAITNGGGLRANLPAGPLTYGSLYEALPFDNRFAMITMTEKQLAKLMRRNLEAKSGIFSVSGIEVQARCRRGKLAVTIRRSNGRRIRPSRKLLVATNDFLATGGDGMFKVLHLPKRAMVIKGAMTIRDAVAHVLERRGGTLRPADFFHRKRRRLVYPGKRPVHCH